MIICHLVGEVMGFWRIKWGEERGDQLSAIREYIGGTVENCIPMNILGVL